MEKDKETEPTFPCRSKSRRHQTTYQITRFFGVGKLCAISQDWAPQTVDRERREQLQPMGGQGIPSAGDDNGSKTSSTRNGGEIVGTKSNLVPARERTESRISPAEEGPCVVEEEHPLQVREEDLTPVRSGPEIL